MASFSGAVRIGDLNDFIAPSQACVVTLNGNKLDINAEAEASTCHMLHCPKRDKSEHPFFILPCSKIRSLI